MPAAEEPSANGGNGSAGYPDASDNAPPTAPSTETEGKLDLLTGRSDLGDVEFVQYKDENDMPGIVGLIDKDLSEPYSVFTYRYFINNWPQLCFMTNNAAGECVGAIVCKLDMHRSRNTHRGYIAMLAVDKGLRGKGIGKSLVRLSLDVMMEMGADECVLETEEDNKAALGLYKSMGFVKEKRLHKYYLNGNDAFRLKFLFKLPEGFKEGRGCLGPPVSPGAERCGQGDGDDHHGASLAESLQEFVGDDGGQDDDDLPPLEEMPEQ